MEYMKNSVSYSRKKAFPGDHETVVEKRSCTVNIMHRYKTCIVMNITKAAKPMTIIIYFQNY